DLLRLVVDRLAESPRVALARIWLVQRSEDCDGCVLLAECRDRSACLHLVASAGRSSVDPKVEWTRLDGAFRRFPLGVRKVERIEELTRRLERENEYLREEVTRAGAFGELIGGGPALEALARKIDLVAPTDAAVLILGESGTGKELVAREVHRRSGRSARPLI